MRNIFKPEREEALIKDIIKQSNSSNPEFIERVWRLLISENLFCKEDLEFLLVHLWMHISLHVGILEDLQKF